VARRIAYPEREGDTRLRLERLTFVHHGDQGTIGRLIAETRGVLRFGADGSGLIELQGAAGGSTPESGMGRTPSVVPNDASVRIYSVAFSSLPQEVQAELSEGQVPCMLGHSGVATVTLLSSRSCARVGGSLSDLRGKVRYALAKVGWEL
jgi:hypothetical protein